MGSQYNYPKFMAKTQSMLVRLFLGTVILLFSFQLHGQKKQEIECTSTPVVGAVSHREALVYVEATGTFQLMLKCMDENGNTISTAHALKRSLANDDLIFENVGIFHFHVKGLKPGTQYKIQVYEGKKELKCGNTGFKTPVLWEWRTPAPDFSFLTGSCLFINETEYDRPGTPYGKSTDIITTMAKMPGDFNLWLGDNLYFREVDYSSPYGMLARYIHTRRNPEVQKLLAARPNYAIWDDHDFGPNNADRSFTFKKHSLNLFTTFWPSFVYGDAETKGAFSSFSYSDVDFFLLDNRYYRASNLLDTADPDKDYWGDAQLRWLKEKLLNSRASFKLIVNGNQVINPMTDSECLNAYPREWENLKSFLVQYKIPGIVFLSGDRHFTEMLKLDVPGLYPLYDFTCSPLTSGAYTQVEKSAEGNNPLRVEGSLIPYQNFARISCSGNKNQRELKIEVLNTESETFWSHTIRQEELKVK